MAAASANENDLPWTKAELELILVERLGSTTKHTAAFSDLLAAAARWKTRKNAEFTIPGSRQVSEGST